MRNDVVPSDPSRVRAFARFFKNYMSISSVVAAALPIPVTSLRLIPTFVAQTALLSTYASLFCFLTLGFVFYSRHQLGRLMFPEMLDGSVGLGRRFQRSLIAFLPALLIALSLAAVWGYHWFLDLALISIAQGPVTSEETTVLLGEREIYDIPYNIKLMFLYLAIFVFAEAAFITMALKEYIQDLVRLSEIEILGRTRRIKRERVESSDPKAS